MRGRSGRVETNTPSSFFTRRTPKDLYAFNSGIPMCLSFMEGSRSGKGRKVVRKTDSIEETTLPVTVLLLSPKQHLTSP